MTMTNVLNNEELANLKSNSAPPAPPPHTHTHQALLPAAKQ
jgi:hypothetical protein